MTNESRNRDGRTWPGRPSTGCCDSPCSSTTTLRCHDDQPLLPIHRLPNEIVISTGAVDFPLSSPPPPPPSPTRDMLDQSNMHTVYFHQHLSSRLGSLEVTIVERPRRARALTDPVSSPPSYDAAMKRSNTQRCPPPLPMAGAYPTARSSTAPSPRSEFFNDDGSMFATSHGSIRTLRTCTVAHRV